MKRTLSLLALLTIIITNAQDQTDQNKYNDIQKGTWNLTGNFSVSFRNSQIEGNVSNFNNNVGDFESEGEIFGFNFSPQVGYAIKDNLIAGLGIGYGYSDSESESLSNNNSNFIESISQSFSVFPFVRWYKPIGNLFSFYIQGEGRYARSWADSEANDFESSSTGNSIFIGVRPGITFFFSEHVAIEANIGSLGYTYSNFDSFNDNFREDESDFNDFSFSLDSSNLLFGVAYYF